jgi:outer membrane protein TolC
MTLEKCRETALANNRSITIAALNQDQAEYTRKAYRANYFPKFSATGNYLYTNKKIKYTLTGNYLPTFVPDPATGALVPNILAVGSDGKPIFKEYAYFPDMDLSLNLSGAWMAGVRAEQPLFTGGKITAGYKMARIGGEIAALNMQLSRADLIVQTDEAYWTYVQANELLKLAFSYQRAVAELLRNVQDAQQAGMKHANDVLKVQVKANEAELQILRAQNGVNLARKNLCHIMGLPLHTPLALPESVEEPPPFPLNRKADPSNRPEWALLEKQVELKAQQINLVRSDFLPQIGIMAHYGYANGLQLNGSKLLDNASFSVLASVTIPLFQWGEGRNKIRAAQAERAAARLQRENIGEQMTLDLSRAIDKCDESALEVSLTARSLRQAEENMHVSRLQYDAGMEPLSALLESQTAWRQAYMEYINAVAGLRVSETRYLRGVGELKF